MPPAWNPATVRARKQLKFSPSERAAVRSKCPVAEDNRVYVDAVFEGGGVKAIAFLGALRCLSDAGIRVRKVAGTSAGGLSAAVIASGMPVDEIERTIGGMDFSHILSKKKSSLIWNGDPGDDMDNVGLMLANLALAGVNGQYSTGPLLDWTRTVLAGRLDTFGEIGAPATAPWYEQRELKIVVSDITAGQMVVLPEDLPAYGLSRTAFSVAEAVRLSMSIPLFFEPGALGDSVIVDGGILSSFPLWIFDSASRPRCPTFGFKVSSGAQKPRVIDTALDVVAAIAQTMTVARDRHYSRVHDYNRIVTLDADTSMTNFNMGNDEKDRLYEKGYAMTKRFLLDKWDWTAYLAARGFSA
jgi:NTE family protein